MLSLSPSFVPPLLLSASPPLTTFPGCLADTRFLFLTLPGVLRWATDGVAGVDVSSPSAPPRGTSRLGLSRGGSGGGGANAGAWPYNRPCAQQYVGKSQSCMVISGRLIVHAPAAAQAARRREMAMLTPSVQAFFSREERAVRQEEQQNAATAADAGGILDLATPPRMRPSRDLAVAVFTQVGPLGFGFDHSQR